MRALYLSSKRNIKTQDIFLLLYIALVFAKHVYSFSNLLLSVYAFCFFLVALDDIFKRKTQVLFLSLLLGIACLISCYYNKYSYIYPVEVLGNIGIGYLVWKNGINLKILKIIIYVMILFFVYQIAIKGVSFNEISETGSRNLIGWIPLSLAILYTALYYRTYEKFNFFVLIPVWAFCLYIIGRSNIIASTLLVLLALFFTFTNVKLWKKTLFFLVALGAAYIAYDLYFDFFFQGTVRFQQMGVESEGRSLLLAGYWRHLSFETLITGVPNVDYPFSLFDGNFHNSFLDGHSHFGVWFILFMIYVIILFFNKRNTRLNKITIALILVLFLRATTDTVMFIGPLDFIFYFMFFQLLFDRKKTSETLLYA